MIPENSLSSQQIVRQLITEHAGLRPTEAYHRGGVALNDPSLGLDLQLWSLRFVGRDFLLSAEQVAEAVLFSVTGEVSSASLAFDQNMRPFVAFIEDGTAKYRWFDTLDSTTKITVLPGASSVKCCTDDLRVSQIQRSDIIMAYIGPAGLCYRQQRDRYLTERVLQPGVGGVLHSVGMNKGLRLQFRISAPTGVAPGLSIATEPPLGEVVLNLAARAGITGDKVDVSELYADKVYGYRVANTDGVDAAIKPLAEAYAFNPGEYDKKLRFKKRGARPVARVTWRDLVSNDPPMKRTTTQEDRLPRRVHVNHLDPAGGYAKNKQSAQRRSNVVRTKRETKLDFDFALPADVAAEIAMRELKAPYYEQMSYEFELGLKFSHLTVNDVIEFVDRDGTLEVIRLEEIDREDGTLKINGRSEGGPDVYGVAAVGLSLNPPRSTTPGLVGNTRVEILNVPVLRDEHDELGLLIAMSGDSSAWSGAQLMTSTDLGATYVEAFRSQVPAIIGDTTTPLAADGGYLYPSQQTVEVQTNFELSSTTDAGILSGANKAVIGDEIIQFQTATHLGNNLWRLSGLVRGRYNTVADAWPIGTRFVLIDESLQFVQLQRWMLGQTFFVKGVGFGLTIDEVIPDTFEFDEAVNQTEWPPHAVVGTRDGSNNLIISFVPRARLGVETTPYNSKYFRGFRIKFSDGFSVDTLSTTYTRTGTVPPLTFTVHALNEITGEGPASEAVTA